MIYVTLGLAMIAATAGQNGPGNSPAPKPRTICGIDAASAREFESLVSRSSDYQEQDATPLYRSFASRDRFSYSWVFAKPGNPAYPLATCRHVYQGADGAWYQTRDMRCDASLASCDQAFQQFRDVDEQARRALQSRSPSSPATRGGSRSPSPSHPAARGGPLPLPKGEGS